MQLFCILRDPNQKQLVSICLTVVLVHLWMELRPRAATSCKKGSAARTKSLVRVVCRSSRKDLRPGEPGRKARNPQLHTTFFRVPTLNPLSQSSVPTRRHGPKSCGSLRHLKRLSRDDHFSQSSQLREGTAFMPSCTSDVRKNPCLGPSLPWAPREQICLGNASRPLRFSYEKGTSRKSQKSERRKWRTPCECNVVQRGTSPSVDELPSQVSLTAGKLRHKPSPLTKQPSNGEASALNSCNASVECVHT